MSEEIKHNRRRFLSTAAITLAAAQLGMFRSADAESRKAELADAPTGPTDGLRRELVADASQGVQLATVQKLAQYWVTDYDWRKCEAKLNSLPQFVSNNIHTIYDRRFIQHHLCRGDDRGPQPRSGSRWTLP